MQCGNITLFGLAEDALRPAGSDDPLPPHTQWYCHKAHKTLVVLLSSHSKWMFSTVIPKRVCHTKMALCIIMPPGGSCLLPHHHSIVNCYLTWPHLLSYQKILSQEHVSGQSGLSEHLSCIWWKDHTRPMVECDPSTRYNECFLTSRLTMNWCS